MIKIPTNLTKFLATGFYSGTSPIAPGTVGSAVYLLLAYILGSLVLVPLFPILGDPLSQISFILILFLVSIAVTKDALQKNLFEVSGTSKKVDPQQIVIDEFLGMAVTLLFCSFSVQSLILAFLFFRAFDVVKPYPICKVEALPGAWGIVLDDFLAGIGAGLALWLLEQQLL